MRLRLVVLITIFTHAAYAGGRVAVSLLAVSLQASPFAIGIVMSLFAVLPMLFSVTVGRAIDRIGMRAPMLWASATVAAGSAIPAVLPTLTGLALSAAVTGSAFMIYHIAVSNMVGALGRPEDRPRNFSYFSMGFSTSGFGGPLVAGFAIDYLGFREAFLVLAAFPLVTALVLAWRGHQVPGARIGERPAGRRLMDLLRNRHLLAVFFVSGALSTGWDLFTFVMPIYAARTGHSASTIGIIMAAFALATFLVRVVLPWLSRRYGEWRLLAAAFFTAMAVYLVFPLVVAAPVLIALAFVLGLGLGSSQPMVLSLLYTSAPAGRAGEAVGVRTTLVNASQTFMPLAFGAVGAVLGMVPVFWAMAAILAAAGWFAARR